MARGTPNRPPKPDTPEGRLEATVKEQYPEMQRFFEAVAARLTTSAATEKSSFYRYTRRGKRIKPDRLKVYAELLKVPLPQIERAHPATPPDELEARIRVLEQEVAALRRGAVGSP